MDALTLVGVIPILLFSRYWCGGEMSINRGFLEWEGPNQLIFQCSQKPATAVITLSPLHLSNKCKDNRSTRKSSTFGICPPKADKGAPSIYRKLKWRLIISIMEKAGVGLMLCGGHHGCCSTETSNQFHVHKSHLQSMKARLQHNMSHLHCNIWD